METNNTTTSNKESARQQAMMSRFQDLRREAIENESNVYYVLARPRNMSPIITINPLGEEVVGINLDTDDGIRPYSLTKTAASQMAGMADIPQKYYDQLSENNQDLLVRCLGDGIRNISSPMAGNLLRINGDIVEAVVSDKYVVLTNAQTFALASQLIAEYNLDPDVCYSSNDQTLTINLLSQELSLDLGPSEKNLKVRDIMRFGIRMTNNSVGLGSFSIQLLTHRLICLNGMSIPRSEDLRIRHHGAGYDLPIDKARRLEAAEVNKYSDEDLIDRSMVEVNGKLTETNVQKVRRQIDTAKTILFTVRDASLLVQAIAQRIGVTVPAQSLTKFCERLIRSLSEGQISTWDFANVFTRQAQDLHDVGIRATIEEKSQRILELSRDDVKAIEHIAYLPLKNQKLPMAS